MRIWILKASEPTPYDALTAGTRLYRYGMLSECAVELGHEVLWWTDDFSHHEKRHRFREDRLVSVRSGLDVQFVHTPGYRRNKSPRRFWDHRILARRFERMADSHRRPDVILAGLPTDWFCMSAVRVGRRYGVPVVLDVRDLWPDVFYQQVPPVLRPILRLLVRPMERRVQRAFSQADAIIGNTQGFVEWGLRKAKRSWHTHDRVIPMGYRPPSLTPIQVEAGYKFWSEKGIRVDDDIFTVCFLGSIGPMFDFQPVIQAARELSGDHASVRFVLCGRSKENHLERLRAQIQDLPNVLLPGWVNAEQMAALMSMSDIGLAPYRNDVNFRKNLPNKPAEYCSAGLPFLVSIDGVMSDLVSEWNCGQRYDSGSELAEAIRSYRDNSDRLRQESANAKRLYRERLNADRIYADLVNHLQEIATMHREDGGRHVVGTFGRGALVQA